MFSTRRFSKILRTTTVAFILFALPSLFPLPLSGQVGDSLQKRVKSLKLDSLQSGLWVFYSNGHASRAEKIGRQIAASNSFYKDSLGITVNIQVGLLDTVDFGRISSPLPYGLPHISDGMAVMPANLSKGAVRDMYAPFETTASEDIQVEFKSIGYSFGEALDVMIDLIGLHEIGHAQITSFDLDARQKWFNEFLASYFSYAYMRSQEPEMAIVWDQITRAGLEGYSPTHKTLNEFNELYVGMGVGDYVWFQNFFQERIKEVYNSKGMDFIKLVKERFSEPSFQPASASDLLLALEKIEPGFIAWEESLEQY